MAQSPLLITNRRKTILTFDFLTLPLFTMDAGAYVEQHRTCMHPLLVTMRGVHANLIAQVLTTPDATIVRQLLESIPKK